jgi:hypothetical protein
MMGDLKHFGRFSKIFLVALLRAYAMYLTNQDSSFLVQTKNNSICRESGDETFNTNRVTRMGDFSPIRRFITLGSS